MTQPGSKDGRPTISLLGAGEGLVAEAFGNRIVFHIDGERSGGAMTQWVSHIPPGGGAPPHVHANEDEAFYLLSGTVSFLEVASGEWTELKPGASVYMPRGVFHSFKNNGSESATMLVTTTPAGFERYFARCAEVFARPGSPDMARIAEINAEFGISFAGPG
ncbi:MAG: cupin domain-containing protein [Trueperaceae bacterium]|nr:cupin domain-containing protein [Trueperaceae bacterium]